MLNLLRPVVSPFLRMLFEEFEISLRRPREFQQRLLQTIIGNLAATEYGRSYSLKTGDGGGEFRAKIPLATYDGVSEWVERQKRYEGRALVNEPVLFYEKTSGSSGPAKFIPYTRSLKNSFNRMALAWLYDLLANAPPLRTGRTFISVSPAFRHPDKTDRGVPIGLGDDSEYLSRWAQAVLKPFFILPPDVKRLQVPANFKRVVAALLVAEKGLEVISVWNPSFLEIILDYIRANRESLGADLQSGAVECEARRFAVAKPGAERMALLNQDPPDWQRLWPGLKLISCWTSAQAATAARRIQALFSDTLVQGKGLLATEAPMTMPLLAARGFVPLPAEVFYEFLDEAGGLSLLHELEVGREYEIIVTQQGGLSRYRIGDRVRVTHFYQAVPCLEFVGRGDTICDLVGEKLNERFVQNCLPRLSETADFQMLVPTMGKTPGYLFLVDRLSGPCAQLEAEMEALITEAYHYRNARLLGQLGPIRVVVAPQAREIYYDYFASRGMKLGDIKQRYLLTSLSDADEIMERVERLLAHR